MRAMPESDMETTATFSTTITTTMASTTSTNTNTTNIDSLLQSWNDFNLSGVETDEICINGLTDYAKITTEGYPSLVGKLITCKPYNKAALFSYLKSAWNLTGWVRFKEALDDVILIQFGKTEEKRRILKENPWLFRKWFFIVENIEGQVSHKEIGLHTIPLWVQIFGLPRMGYTVSLGQKVASKLGEVLALDEKRKTSWKSGLRGHGYMRAKIQMSIHASLPRGTTIVDEDGSRLFLGFRYERLHNFCFHCGKLGHVMTDCIPKDAGDDHTLKFGDWLRAASDLPHSFLNRTDQILSGGGPMTVGDKGENTRQGEESNFSLMPASSMHTRNVINCMGIDSEMPNTMEKRFNPGVLMGDVMRSMAHKQINCLSLPANLLHDINSDNAAALQVVNLGILNDMATPQLDKHQVEESEEDPVLATFFFKSKRADELSNSRKLPNL